MSFRLRFFGPHVPDRPWPVGGDSPVPLGRGPANTIRISDVNVSRRHAAVFVVKGRCMVRDLGSRNGIFVNGQQVAEAPLRHDDEVRIGIVTGFRVEEVREVSPAAETFVILHRS